MTDPTHDEDVRLVRRSVIRDNEERASEALDRILSRYKALVAERDAHEAYELANVAANAWPDSDAPQPLLQGELLLFRDDYLAAHDNAERVIRRCL